MILKLIAGQRIAFAIESITEAVGKFGPQLKFQGATPDDSDAALFMNVEPATRQLERIGLDVGSAIGRTIVVERVDKGGTLYTNFHKAGTTTVAAPSKAKQAFSSGPALPGEESTPPTPTLTGPTHPLQTAVEKLDRMFAIYDVIESHVLATSVKKYTDAEVGTTPESVAAQVATLFIEANKRGLAA